MSTARWVSSLSGIDEPGCGATQLNACLTIQAAYDQCAFAKDCEIDLESATYAGIGNLNLTLERAAISDSSLTVRSWPCVNSISNEACAVAPRARVACSGTDKGWILSAQQVVIQGIAFDGCQTPSLNATLPDMYGGLESVALGSALLILNSSSVAILDVTMQRCATGYALAVLPGDPRSPPPANRDDPNVSVSLAITVDRSTWINNTGGAVLLSSCAGFNANSVCLRPCIAPAMALSL